MSEFHFLRPWWFLALIPALLLLWSLWRGRVEGSAWRKVVAPHLLERLWLESPGNISRLPLLLLGAGWLLAVSALAGPVWERRPEPVWRAQAARILILDLSASMDAADMAPSRLERARFKIQDILKKNREGRTGLLVFAGEPHTVSPLTDDGATVANLLTALSTDIVPAAGDAAAPALRLGSKLLQQAGAAHGDLLLLSDGISDPAAAMSAAQDLRRQGYRLSVLAIGTSQGAPLPGSGGRVMVRLNAAPLQELARTGGGSFSLMTADDSDLARVLSAPSLSSPEKQQGDSGVERWIERGVWLLPLLLLLGASGFRRGWLAGLVALMVLPPPADAFDWQGLWLRQDQQAARALQQGQSDKAAKQFTDPAWRGMALYRSGKYAEAAKSFAESQEPTAKYNHGNALARAGKLEQAAKAYREVLQRSPDHADAKANLELVEKLLQQQQKQQQQSQQDSQQGQQKDKPSEKNQQQGGRQQQQQGQQDQQKDKSSEQNGQQGKQQKSQQNKEGEQGAEKQDRKEGAQGESQEKQQQQSDSSQGSDKEQDSMEAALRDVEDQVGQKDDKQKQLAMKPDKDEGKSDAEGEPLVEQSQPEKPPNEKQLALEQWLRQIPEDPAGLLRRKFMLEHLKRMKGVKGGE